MKALIWKDLYCIANTIRSMVVVLVFLAVCLIPSAGPEGYAVFCTWFCTMMVLNTFSFDEYCKWNHFALTMPVSRREIVRAKYLVLVLLSVTSAVFGMAIAAVARVVLSKALIWAELKALPLVALAGVCVSLMLMGSVIPLVLKFGPEKARLFLVLVTAIPAGLLYAGNLLLNTAGIVITGEMLTTVLPFFPLPALAWTAGTYAISCRIFEKEEL